MVHQNARHLGSSEKGFTLIELLIVVSIMGVLTALAVPQMLVQRRLTRSTAVTREIMTQMRYTRQLAMSERRAFTFQYDAVAREMKVIGPIPVGAAALATATGYPNNPGSAVLATVSLNQGGLVAAEIDYGMPSTLPTGATGALADGVSKTPLVSGKLNITFQPDGAVIDTSGNPASAAMFFYNSKMAEATASAVSVLGASGRVKVWRYSLNATKYVE